MNHRRSAARRLRPLMALLLLLVPDRGSAGPLVSPPVSPEEDAAFRSEWEKLRANQERAIRDNEKPLAEIRGPEGGAGAAAIGHADDRALRDGLSVGIEEASRRPDPEHVAGGGGGRQVDHALVAGE